MQIIRMDVLLEVDSMFNVKVAPRLLEAPFARKRERGWGEGNGHE
jgi:hypothetical protein